LYVKLDGERIRFDSGIPNQAARLVHLQLPSLKALCPTMTSLNSNFEPPYSGAAAVFDLPQGNVSACMVARRRIDTEIGLESSGFLTISASTMRVRKEIKLKPDSTSGRITLIVANVPATCLTGTCSTPSPKALDGVTHVHAYYAMGNCQGTTKSITTWAGGANSPQRPRNQCTVSVPDAAGGFGMSENGHNHGADFECSNSSWP
ncbi:MAG TPA: hypothetical protein VNN08_07515, partial [Thermoanaerobaculia bacterium]|nr:hypothetical protein [Thermoanaerobaculia bacterium]